MGYAPLAVLTPFAADLNLGRACNEAMALVPDDGWACIVDHDMMWTTSSWWAQIQEAIAFRPDAGAFTVVTNRIAAPWQRAMEADPHNNDIAYHRQVGAERAQRRTLLDITGTKGFGGVVTVVSKAAWRECGGWADGMYCADHSLFFRLQDAGRRVWLIEGLYVYHFRGSSSRRPPLPAPIAEGCRCRGREEPPTVRVSLP